jgi:adenylate cyclase
MAMVMQSRMEKLREHYVNSGVVKDFSIRMGINTGYCTVGNFGSLSRMDYTIIGGEVNLAARLESVAEKNQILLSHETYSIVKDKINCQKKESVSVKGISLPVQTYQVVNSTLQKSTTFEGMGYKLIVDENLVNKETNIKQLLKDNFENG